MFKKLLPLLLSTLYLFAAPQDFIDEMRYETNYASALKKAKEHNKAIMMVISTESCPWCRKLERQTLRKDNINEIVKANFIPLAITRDVGEYPKQFIAKVVPTVYFIDPKDEKPFDISYGYKNKKIYEDVLNTAKSKFIK